MKFNSVVLALSLVVSTPSVLAQNSTTGSKFFSFSRFFIFIYYRLLIYYSFFFFKLAVTGSSSIVAGSLLIQNNLNVLVAAIQAQLLSALALLRKYGNKKLSLLPLFFPFRTFGFLVFATFFFFRSNL